MSKPDAAVSSLQSEAWKWWESHRLIYNLALVAACAAAYILWAILRFASGWPPWVDWTGAVSMTLYCAGQFIVPILLANVCYMLGAVAETGIRPSNKDAFRKLAFKIGLCLSVALPFLFAAITLVRFILFPELIGL